MSLTLRSDQYIGLIPQSFFNDLSFPHLTSLSLTSIIFDCSYYPDNVKPDSSSEDFIIRHKSTLTYLELIACPMHDMVLGIAYHKFWPIEYISTKGGPLEFGERFLGQGIQRAQEGDVAWFSRSASIERHEGDIHDDERHVVGLGI